MSTRGKAPHISDYKMPTGIYNRQTSQPNRGIFVSGHKRGMNGKKHSKITIEKMRKAQAGERSHCFGKKDAAAYAYKGERVGYRGLHRWVVSRLGKAAKCEHCGKQKTTPKSIHWANISKKYKRELTDWIPLCPKCHKKYDKK